MAEPAASEGEDLQYPAPRRRTRWWFVGSLVIAAVVVVAVLRIEGAGESNVSSAPSAPASSITSAPLTPVPITAAPSTATHVVFPEQPVALAVAQACRGASSCRPVDGSATVRATARRALGAPERVVVRVLTGRALVVAALLSGGRQLLVAVARPGVRIDPRRLGIPAPMGVQTQHNGRDLLVVTVSGSVAALRLLGRPAIQRWLARLTI